MSFPTRRVPLLFGAAAAAVCLGFAAFTGHMWEDYFITFRASLNLATGNGLVFQPGERVHSFTSPLGTLLPALFALGGGEDVAVRALWGFRVVSALAIAAAIGLIVAKFRREGLAPLAIAAATLGGMLDPKLVDFAMNGMETALVVAFTTLTWHAFASGARVVPCALGLAGLQWTRPDGCVFFGAIALAWCAFGESEVRLSWQARLWLFLRVAVLAGVIYLPWFVFAWWYYGSPVPHTIIAKLQSNSLLPVVLYPWRLLFGDVWLQDIFMPAYHYLGGWPDVLAWPARILALGGALAWTWPRVARPGRMASAAFFLGGFYVQYIPQSPWYYPGWQILAWPAWGYLLHALWNVRPATPWAAGLPQTAARITATLIVILQGSLLACTAWQMRTQQALVESGHRREIGLWLAQNAARSHTVFLECLGYIGYYSQLKMLDYPGLSSPEVVAARRAGHRSFAKVVQALGPDWLVLRPGEAAMIYEEAPNLREAYRFVRAFDVNASINALNILPGRGYLKFDAVFLIYRRVTNDAVTAPAGVRQP